jgi:hypothetical protein
MADFTETEIEIGYYTDNWGPYAFKFPIATSETANDGVIPYGDTIASVSIKAYIGNVNRKSTLGDETLIPAGELIDSDFVPSITDGNVVKCKFVWNSAHKENKATLIFECTMTSGGKRSFYFQYVKIR